MRVLSDIEMRLKNPEALRPVVPAHHEANKEVRGREHVPPTVQHVILVEIILDGINILLSSPLSLHCFLNVRNAMELKVEFALT